MPRYEIPLGTAGKAWAALNPFVQGYLEMAFFTSTGTPEDGGLYEVTFDQFDARALERVLEDCRQFRRRAEMHLHHACQEAPTYTEHDAGGDFWLGRNGHADGFWSRAELPTATAEDLAHVARTFPKVHLFRSEVNGRLYIE